MTMSDVQVLGIGRYWTFSTRLEQTKRKMICGYKNIYIHI